MSSVAAALREARWDNSGDLTVESFGMLLKLNHLWF